MFLNFVGCGSMSQTGSLTGMFLIATRELRDPHFFKSIVFLVEHNASGAMGFVINRPTELEVDQVLSEQYSLDGDDVIYSGGPVERAALFLLHALLPDLESEAEIIPGLTLAGSSQAFDEAMEAIARSPDPVPHRIFSGCAGWGPEQLEGELSRADWLVLPATFELVFDESPYDLWDRLFAEYRRQHPLAPGLQQDPRWN